MSDHIAEDFRTTLLAVREAAEADNLVAEPAVKRIETLTDLVLAFLDRTWSGERATKPADADARLAA